MTFVFIKISIYKISVNDFDNVCLKWSNIANVKSIFKSYKVLKMNLWYICEYLIHLLTWSRFFFATSTLKYCYSLAKINVFIFSKPNHFLKVLGRVEVKNSWSKLRASRHENWVIRELTNNEQVRVKFLHQDYRIPEHL